ncbi:ribonuclease HII [Clostridium polynesiense]|uniref:ribonuclease HII n=1 Tax=Clostridium polynesiense TaxID=1325933 RepID=UPI00058E4A49|nr:ribonuclease HII [Clostridium polynesiense]
MIEIDEKILNNNYKQICHIIKNIDLLNMTDYNFTLLTTLLGSDSRKNVKMLCDKLIKEKNKKLQEIERVNRLYSFDKAFSKNAVLAGVDEVGRGPLAGPIVAAAVILDLNDLTDIILFINDSKSLSSALREEISKEIKNKALAYSIASCSNKVIDEKGISFCNNKVFLDSVKGLPITPDIVLSDGYKIKDYNGKNEAVIKGDTKSASIACASIIAKVYRDNLMKEYHKVYPDYDFNSNAGYGSKKHIEAIANKGICEIHRKSFVRNFV